MADLSEHVGAWAGTNGFRLMPGDPFAESPAAASVATAAGGHLTSVAYSWTHPDDGPQEGLIVIGPTGDGDGLVAMWGDSWHQQPAPMSLTGTRQPGGAVALEAPYAGNWGWQIRVDAADAGSLRIRMANVVPADQAVDGAPAGPYDAMVMDLRRA